MTATTLGPPVLIDGPLPEAPPYGLVPSVPTIPTVDEHWISGGSVYGYLDDLPVGFDLCGDGSARVKVIARAAPLPTFGAFAIYLAMRCNSWSIGSDEELHQRVERAFAAVESFAVEQEFAAGLAMPLNPHLNDGGAAAQGNDLASGAAVGPVEALALLEDAIGRTGKQGVIHATPSSVIAWDQHVLDVAGKLRTRNGTLVVSGGGYIDQVDDSAGALSADEQWAWATGPIEIRRSGILSLPTTLAEALDRGTNEVTVYAERAYLPVWDTALQASVLVDRSQ
jgi:hypothetical protein